MPLNYIKTDITKLRVDAVVHLTNNSISGEGCYNDTICHIAGEELLRDTEYCTVSSIASGTAVITKGYKLPAQYIIHTKMPVYVDGNHDEDTALRLCFRNTLKLALEHNLESLAFPLISSGQAGYPKNLLADVTVDEIRRFLLSDHPDMDISLVLSDSSESFLSKDRFLDLLADISRNSAKEKSEDEKPGIFSRIKYYFLYKPAERRRLKKELKRIEEEECLRQEAIDTFAAPNPMQSGKKQGSDHNGEIPIISDKKDIAAESDRRKQQNIPNNLAEGKTISRPDSAHTSSDGFFDAFLNHHAGGTSETAVPEKTETGTLMWKPQETMMPSPPLYCEEGSPKGNKKDIHPQMSFPAHPRVNPEELRRRLIALDESFSDMLLRKIDEKGMTDVECYKKANIDRKLFSKIRSNRYYMPKKITVLAFAVALNLTIEETEEMLKKAGYALSGSNKTDIIVKYYISRRNYNIFDINEALYEFGQHLLGA